MVKKESFMIPENKQEAVEKALQSVFGTPKYDDIEQIFTGLSTALVFRIEVQGKSYLLKIITRTDEFGNPTRLYASMKKGAEAGIAPRVLYSDIEDKLSITDFIQAKPFPIAKAQDKLVDVLCTLHSFPPFQSTNHSLDTANRFIQKFREAGILPGTTTEELFRLFEKITGVYPRNKEDLVASFNDLKPENILFDGDRAWLVDWEAIFNNDKYSDLAIVANFVVRNEEDKAAFLKRYFGREITEYEFARFYLMLQIMHMCYFSVFMVVVFAKGKPIDLNAIATHDFRNFHDRMWAGEIDLADDNAKLEYALIHMEELSRNMHSEKFKIALGIVSNTNLNDKE